MKNHIFNKSKYLLSGLLFIATFTACIDDTVDIEFVAQEPTEAVNFSSTLSDNYILSDDTRSNIAERFVWNVPDFETPTTINYLVEGSTTATFDIIDYDSGTLSETNHGVKVSVLLGMAETLGLDTDPGTTDDEGNPNNTGTVYFRVKAFVGSNGATNAAESVSDIAILNISLVEETGQGGGGIQIATWGVVGSGANDWGNAGPDLPFYTTGQTDVLVAYVNLKDGEIKFRENNEWINDFGDTDADGTLDAGGDNIAVTAGDYKITMDLNALTYTIEPFSWGIVGSAWNDWGGAGPDAKFFYDYTTDTFKVGVRLLDGEMKFRMNNEWVTDFGDTGADGTLDAGGDNIVTTAGHYLVTLDLTNNVYTVEAADLYGVVGSGYNDWGGAGPDFTFTEFNPGKWIAENVTLIDGEIKFRVNNDWASDFGDTGADGILDAGGDNIAVTAGTYDIFLDLTDAGAPTYTMITK